MWSLLACTSAEPDEVTLQAPEEVLAFEGGVPSNLVVISLDTTRRDRVGRHSGLPTTPFLDERLAEAVVLEDHRSCSNWTAPSMLCATTGYDPRELGFWPGAGDAEVRDVPRRLPTLASELAEQGFATTLVTSNPVFSDDFSTAQGFRTVILRDFAAATEIRERAVEQLDVLVEGGAPFYLHVHFFDPHREYCPPEAYRAGLDALPEVGFDLCEDLPLALAELDQHDAVWQQALLDRARLLYDGELRYWDDELRQLWGALERRGALDDTLVVWHTDHGEQHLERGRFDHGFHLDAEENRAAAALWAQGLAPRAWSGPTLHQDLAATLRALYGLPQPEGASGVPLGQAPDDRVRRLFAYSVVDYGLPQLALVQGPRVLHYAWDGQRAWHHTDTDPAELDDRYDPQDPELVALWGEMSAYIDEVAALWPHLPASLDAQP
jgi:arylsulfatase A-like enzyme